MNKCKKLELLAPAGDLKRLKYALAYGADAVYLGLPDFSLRAKTGFDLASLKESIAYAHDAGKKVYVTINIFAHEEQLKSLPLFLKKLSAVRPDAIILSDAGVLNLVKKYLPKVPVHLSTQANTLNSEAVKFWQKNGVKRIILGREATLSDIKMIHAAVPKMELEVFVHGAMCMSYSGRCYLSSWLNGRSANEGSCTQPCRWQYRMYLEEPLRPGELMPIEEDGQGAYVLNSKDLCLIEYLPELIKAGVCSVKIEGRTKSHYYTAAAVKVYREAIDACGESVMEASLPLRKGGLGRVLKKLKSELLKIDNRGYTTGFLLGNEGADRQNFQSSKAVGEYQLAGEVVETKNGRIFFRAHNAWRAVELAELLVPGGCYKLKVKEFFDDKGRSVKEVHGGTDKIYSFASSIKAAEKGLIRRPAKS
jgi:U32 family peptidase